MVAIAGIPSSYAAPLRITEVMYNAEGLDVGKEYIELQNIGPGSVSTASISFSEHERAHGILSATVASLAPGDIALIVADPTFFKEHYRTEAAILHAGVFSLNNETSTITLQVNGVVAHAISYTAKDGANGDGTALHIDETNKSTAKTPTPGKTAGIAIAKEEERKKEAQAIPSDPALLLATAPTPVIAGARATFSVTKEETPRYGYWNFGDGTALFGEEVTHTYRYPGTYRLVFEEHHTTERETPQEPAKVQRDITVEHFNVAVLREDENSVVLLQRYPVALEIARWRLVAQETEIIFPSGSFLTPNNPLRIPFKTTADTKEVVWYTAGGGVYPQALQTMPEQKELPPHTMTNMLTLWIALIALLLALSGFSVVLGTKKTSKKPPPVKKRKTAKKKG